MLYATLCSLGNEEIFANSTFRKVRGFVIASAQRQIKKLPQLRAMAFILFSQFYSQLFPFFASKEDDLLLKQVRFADQNKDWLTVFVKCYLEQAFPPNNQYPPKNADRLYCICKYGLHNPETLLLVLCCMSLHLPPPFRYGILISKIFFYAFFSSCSTKTAFVHHGLRIL